MTIVTPIQNMYLNISELVISEVFHREFGAQILEINKPFYCIPASTNLS